MPLPMAGSAFGLGEDTSVLLSSIIYAISLQ